MKDKPENLSREDIIKTLEKVERYIDDLFNENQRLQALVQQPAKSAEAAYDKEEKLRFICREAEERGLPIDSIYDWFTRKDIKIKKADFEPRKPMEISHDGTDAQGGVKKAIDEYARFFIDDKDEVRIRCRLRSFANHLQTKPDTQEKAESEILEVCQGLLGEDISDIPRGITTTGEPPRPDTQEKAESDKQEQIIKDFGEKFLGKMESMPPKYQKLLNDNFWELLSDEGKAKQPKMESPELIKAQVEHDEQFLKPFDIKPTKPSQVTTTYNGEAEAYYVKLSSQPADETIEYIEGICNVDYNKNGEIVGIEILQAHPRSVTKEDVTTFAYGLHEVLHIREITPLIEHWLAEHDIEVTDE